MGVEVLSCRGCRETERDGESDVGVLAAHDREGVDGRHGSREPSGYDDFGKVAHLAGGSSEAVEDQAAGWSAGCMAWRVASWTNVMHVDRPVSGLCGS